VGQEFIIKTDHKSLSFLSDHKATTKIQQKTLLKLMDLNFKIQHKKGISNAAADALSRCVVLPSVHVVSGSAPSWLERVVEGYADDPQAQELLLEFSIASPNTKGYSLIQGVIKHRNRVWIGNNKLAQDHIMEDLHNSGIGGHSGIQATYKRIKALFAWPRMKTCVTDFVRACQICQQAKVEHVKLPGLLQPLPVPSQAWSTVSLDFIEGLPKLGGYDVIFSGD
jgi:hypothetical protein